MKDPQQSGWTSGRTETFFAASEIHKQLENRCQTNEEIIVFVIGIFERNEAKSVNAFSSLYWMWVPVETYPIPINARTRSNHCNTFRKTHLKPNSFKYSFSTSNSSLGYVSIYRVALFTIATHRFLGQTRTFHYAYLSASLILFVAIVKRIVCKQIIFFIYNYKLLILILLSSFDTN